MLELFQLLAGLNLLLAPSRRLKFLLLSVVVSSDFLIIDNTLLLKARISFGWTSSSRWSKEIFDLQPLTVSSGICIDVFSLSLM